MRIVGGKYKGKRFSAPKNLPTRPTTDFAKEGLFNILQHQMNLENKYVLDLFAGTGNMSFEFASRGAEKVVAIEQNYRAVKFIATTAKTFDMPIDVYKNDVFKGISKVQYQFDIIFADPPYKLKKLDALPQLILDHKILKEDGMLIVEHGKEHSFENHPCFKEHRKFGNVNFTIFSYG